MKMVAQSHRLTVVFGENCFDALQERQRDYRTHAAAAERQHPLRPGAEQLIIASTCELVHPCDLLDFSTCRYRSGPDLGKIFRLDLFLSGNRRQLIDLAND